MLCRTWAGGRSWAGLGRVCRRPDECAPAVVPVHAVMWASAVFLLSFPVFSPVSPRLFLALFCKFSGCFGYFWGRSALAVPRRGALCFRWLMRWSLAFCLLALQVAGVPVWCCAFPLSLPYHSLKKKGCWAGLNGMLGGAGQGVGG